MTYGSFRLVIRKLCPGVDVEILDNWIANRYQEILDRLPWKRIESDVVISCPSSYATGTITAVQGSATITGVGTTWATTMNGLVLRINNQPEYYQFTYVSPTSATLDRVYEAASADSLTYRIDQAIFVLPANCRVIRGVKPMHDRESPLTRKTPGELNDISTDRNNYGTPCYFTPAWDNFSDPPRLQIELFPIPSVPNSSGALLSFVADCILDPASLDDTTSVSLLPWVRPQALENGVRADFSRWSKDWTGAVAYETRFEELVKAMSNIDSEQRGAQVMQLAPHLKRQRPPRYPHGPRHQGWPG